MGQYEPPGRRPLRDPGGGLRGQVTLPRVRIGTGALEEEQVGLPEELLIAPVPGGAIMRDVTAAVHGHDMLRADGLRGPAVEPADLGAVRMEDGRRQRGADFRYEAQAGNIGINIGVAAPMAFFPFSGWKDSFFGTLHGQARHAVEFFTQTKVVVERWG